MSINYLDLKPQYEFLKDQIHQKMNTIFNHHRFIMGPEIGDLEKKLSQFVGSPHTIACSSGTDSLILALMALDIQRGDEVITTPFTFAATAESIALIGATPVFVDIYPDTYNIDITKVREAITPRTKAIMPVALFGQPADMDELMKIGKEHNLWIIEDAAQSFGAKYKNQRSGAMGHISCTSFFPAKPLGCYGDGGAIFTPDKKIADKMRQLLNHGQNQDGHYEFIGLNGRLDSFQAAVLLCKLERFEWELQKRQTIAMRYTENLKKMETIGWQLPKVAPHCQSSWAQYTVSVPNRTEIQKELQDKGLPTRVYYPSILPEQTAYKKRSISHSLIHAKKASERVMSLPLYADMPEKTQERIIEIILSTTAAHHHPYREKLPDVTFPPNKQPVASP